jgi:YVTN family beta-propeller protein
MANGGYAPTTGFSSGQITTARDGDGRITAAIAVSQTASDNYSTSDMHYRIAGLGVSGFQFYGEISKVQIPQTVGTTSLAEKLALPEPALVVVVALSGGLNNISLSGVPGLVLTSSVVNGLQPGLLIGHMHTAAGSYTVRETVTVQNAGDVARGEVLGIFAFSNVRAGFINHVLPTRVVDKVRTDDFVFSVAYDRERGEIFYTNEYSDYVTVINDTSDTPVANIAVGELPNGLAYDPRMGEVFVGVTFPDEVSVISDSSNTVLTNISVGPNPSGLVYDAGQREVFVTSGPGVSVISDATDTVVATVPTGSGASGVAYDPGKGEVFVTNYESNTVSVINDTTDTVVANIEAGIQPDEVAYDSGTGELFVTNEYNVTVISVTTNKVVAEIRVGGFSTGVVYDGAKNEVFVAVTYADKVNVISDESDHLVATIPTGIWPSAVALDTGKGEVFVSVLYAYVLDVIST